jgi:hypothetical protein
MQSHDEPQYANATLLPRLESLVGLELSIARITGDMTVLGFGPVRTTARGGTVGTFALHLQCAWRIASNASILTGDTDVWEYAGTGDRPENWEPSFGLSLQSRQMDKLLGARLGTSKAFYYASGVSVVECQFEQTTGDIAIDLSSGHRLSVFPNGSRGEQWRFFSTEGEGSPHLVFEFAD